MSHELITILFTPKWLWYCHCARESRRSATCLTITKIVLLVPLWISIRAPLYPTRTYPPLTAWQRRLTTSHWSIDHCPKYIDNRFPPWTERCIVIWGWLAQKSALNRSRVYILCLLNNDWTLSPPRSLWLSLMIHFSAASSGVFAFITRCDRESVFCIVQLACYLYLSPETHNHWTVVAILQPDAIMLFKLVAIVQATLS